MPVPSQVSARRAACRATQSDRRSAVELIEGMGLGGAGNEIVKAIESAIEQGRPAVEAALRNARPTMEASFQAVGPALAGIVAAALPAIQEVAKAVMPTVGEMMKTTLSAVGGAASGVTSRA
jgi:phage-related protein